ncbi:MAG TPA: SPOR domain-containing protein [Trichocoleus sp.]
MSEPAATLKLPLHRALASLSVDLDAELIRYRQSRQGEAVTPTPKGLTFRKRRKPIDLIRVEGKSEVKPTPQQAAVAEPPTPPPPLPPNPRLLQASYQSSYPVNSPVNSAPLDSSALVPAEAPLPESEAPENGALISYTHVPDDYLESTEALLNASDASGLFDSASHSQDTDYEPSLLKSITTPLGLGALLLLLVSSAGLGYLLTNPKALGHLWKIPAIQALQGQSPNAGTDARGGDFEPGLQGLGPDLSQKEFVDLNLARLSTLPSEGTGVPTITSTPTVALSPTPQPGTVSATPSAPTPTAAQPPTPTSAQPRTVVTAPTTISQIPVTVPPRVQAAPARPSRPAAAGSAPATPAPSRPAPAVTVAPQPAPPVQSAPAPLPAPADEPAAAQPAQPNHYVVTDFTGDQSLSTARSAVGDAYVRNFPAGARIQMGAFSDESSAETLVQELQQQGIPAQVYSP